MVALTGAERQKNRRDKKKDNGLVKLELWVTPELKVKLRKLYANDSLRGQPEYITEQLEILRRICESGMEACPDNLVDVFQHLKDEIERTFKAVASLGEQG